MKFEHKESHLHKLAKEMLFKKLKEIETNTLDNCTFKDISWRKNQGVYMELPFYSNSDEYYFENSDHVGPNAVPPGHILFVPDICIFHKGTPKKFIEVVHTSPVSQAKIERMKKFFVNNWFEIYEVDASSILESLTLELEKVQFVKIFESK